MHRLLHRDPPLALVARKYKSAAKGVKPVSTALPEEFRITRHFPEDPLLTLPEVPTHPPEFIPTTKFTRERYEALSIENSTFLWPEEKKLAAEVFCRNEKALAWDETEKGRFREDYFPPVRIPVVSHKVWADKPLPVPPGNRAQVVEIIKAKVAAGSFEQSSSSYSNQWFCVAKKSGKLRIVFNLQKLNAVTIRDSGLPPLLENYVEEFGGAGIYTMLDLFVGYDHRALHPDSRDLTTFQTPIGRFWLTALPMGWTNSVAIFQGDCKGNPCYLSFYYFIFHFP